VDIVHPAALTAPDVVMVRGGGIETPLGTRNIHFPNQSFVGQDLQIAVHGRDADPGKPVSNQLVEFFGSGVAGELPEFVQNRPALLRHSAWFLGVHPVGGVLYR